VDTADICKDAALCYYFRSIFIKYLEKFRVIRQYKSENAATKALKMIPQDKTCLINIGFYCILQKKIEESEKYLQKGRKIYPKKGNFCYNLAVLSARQGDVKKCLEYMKLAIELKASFLDGINGDSEFEPVKKNAAFKNLVKNNKKRKKSKINFSRGSTSEAVVRGQT